VNFETQNRIEILMQVQGCVCSLCEGERGPIPDRLRGRARLNHPLRPTIEHTFPTRYGGAWSWGNITVAHARCNNDKGSRPPTEREVAFLERVNAAIPHLLRMAA